MRSTTAGKCGVVTLAVLLAVSFASPALARLRLGFEVGANYSTLAYEHLDNASFITSSWDPGWRTSFTGGVTLEIPWRQRASFVTGLRYVQQGNRVKFTGSGLQPLSGEFTIAQHYLALPLLLAFRPFPSPRWFFAAGPEGALLLSASTTDHFSSPALLGSTSSITDKLEPLNLSADAEAGLEFPAEKHSWMAIVRYTHGLVDAQRKDDWAVAWKTQGVEGLIGMRW